jgi:uncharacterized protein (DUF58 family)
LIPLYPFSLMLDLATTWLETKWATPAYGGWVLGALSLCFFGAATNTMAGWLYVLSGIGLALLGVGAVLPIRSIQTVTIERESIEPVTAGTDLEVALTIHNPTDRLQTLFQVCDLNPLTGVKPPLTTVEQIAPHTSYRWTYQQPTTQRGVYRWERVVLRSGAPIGLFWSRRERVAAAIAYVYPHILKLDRCPLLDAIGNNERQLDRQSASRRLEAANEGMTRSLRPYRYGDPMKAIHWRTSARFGIFQVRELEIDRSGEDITICLDSGATWNDKDFEQAVVAACSLYFYAARSANLNVKLWTAGTGLITGDRQVLETLAAVQTNESSAAELPPTAKVLLTSQPQQLQTLTTGDRWLLWHAESGAATAAASANGINIDPDRALPPQLSNANFATNRESSEYIAASKFTPAADLN